MTTRLSVEHNVGSVIASVEDIENDLRSELRKRVGAAMDILQSDVRNYVLDDPNTTTNLLRAIKQDESTSRTELGWSVYADLDSAAYAAIVEYGSGSRTNIPFSRGNRLPPAWPSIGSSVPVGFPYESPDMDYNEENPPNTQGYPDFYGFVKGIEEWMRTKPVSPMTGDYFISAAFIAEAIIERGNYAHPYLRPAWFQNELLIKRAGKNAVRNAVR
jgi:hypothetical protein